MIRRTNGFLEEYTDRALKGDILIGRELKKELERLRDDMDDPRYIYDTTEADRRIRFMEGCVRLTKSPFYGQPMELMLYQKAWISALYGFQMAEDGTNRFRRCILLQSRKNGKSELCSALALSELIIGPAGADVVCSSNDDNQANILYVAIDTMRLMIDPKQVDTWRNQQNMRNKITNSKVFKLSDRTRSKEGRNIDFAIVDEVHEMKDNVIVKSIEQSQSLKPNPKLILITTEGFVNGGFLDEELTKARAILNGEDDSISAERYLPWLYTQDSEQEIWQDERTWVKSNPSLGTVKRWDYMREQVDAARRSKSDRMFVLSKDFNLKVADSQAWLLRENVEYIGDYSLDIFHNTIALGAVDLAETTDMCSAKLLMLRPGDTTVKYIHSMYWIPESKLSKSDDREAGARYEEWAQQGILRISPGNEVDISTVADWFYEMYKEYGIRTYCIGYDQRFAKDFLNRAGEYGFQTEMVYQSRYVMTSPMKLVEADLIDHKVMGLNAIDQWCLLNTSIQMWSTGQCMPVKIKGQASRKIDGAVTTIIGYEMLRRHKTEIINAIG